MGPSCRPQHWIHQNIQISVYIPQSIMWMAVPDLGDDGPRKLKNKSIKLFPCRTINFLFFFTFPIERHHGVGLVKFTCCKQNCVKSLLINCHVRQVFPSWHKFLTSSSHNCLSTGSEIVNWHQSYHLLMDFQPWNLMKTAGSIVP